MEEIEIGYGGSTKESLGRKYFKMACLTAGFFALGLPISMFGPTLPTLSYNMNISVTDLAVIFPAKGFGYLVGSMLSGVLSKRVDGQLMIAICLLFTATGTVAIPLFSAIVVLTIFLTFVSVAMGALDTGGNVMCLQLWGKDSEPYMQTLHFFFALGASLAPLVARPFINDIIEYNATTTGNETSSALDSNHTIEQLFGVPKVAWAFFIPGIVAFVVCLSFVYLYCTSSGAFGSSQNDTRDAEGRKFRAIMLSFLFVFFFMYVGLEIAFGIYLYTFCINSVLAYSKYKGTTLNFVFWISFASGRFFSIFLTKCLTPRLMLTLDLIGSGISVVIMVLCPLYATSADWLMWFAVCLLGMSMASVFPSGISWAECYITMTEASASVLVVGAALGEMIIPTLVGVLMYNPMNLIYFCVIAVAMNIATYVAMQLYANTRGPRSNISSFKKRSINDQIETSSFLQEDVQPLLLNSYD